jgi:radical SAM protein with 4Fe4S-binding SPASM domain
MPEIHPHAIAHRAESFGGILLHIPTERMLLVSRPQYQAARALIDGADDARSVADLSSEFDLSETVARNLLDSTRCSIADPASYTATPLLLRNFTERLSAPINVVWEITGSCNLRCRHCFIPMEDHVPTQLGSPDLLRIAELLVQQNVLVVRISGGEPSRHPALEDLLKVLKSSPRHVKLLTNATFVDDRLVSLIRRYVDSLSVSLDGGRAEAHDAIRGRAGAFDKTVDGLRRLRRETTARINVTTSVFRHSIDEIDPIIELCLDLGVDSWKYTLAQPIGRAKEDRSLLPREEELADLARILEKYRGVPTIEPALELLDEYIHPEPQPTWCGGTFDEVAIDPSGHLFPCAYISGLRHFDAGNVLNGEFNALYQGDVFKAFRREGVADLAPDCKAVRLAYFGSIETSQSVYRPEVVRSLLGTPAQGSTP